MRRKMGGRRSWGPGLLLLLWAALASCSGDSDKLQVFPGSSVVLPCDAPPGSDLENLVLEWTRPGLRQRYVFLFRDGRPLLDFQHPQFEGRVTLNAPTLHRGDLSITLHNVSQPDRGIYQCHFVSQSHARKRRSVLGTGPIKTIDLTLREPETIQAFPGQDVLLRLPKPDYPVTSVMWKREDDPERFVFLSGMDHPHHQDPRYSGRTEETGTGDLTVRLRNVQPGDSGTYHGHIVQSQHRAKRELRPSETDNIVVLKVLSSGALELEGGAAFTVAVIMLLFLE